MARKNNMETICGLFKSQIEFNKNEVDDAVKRYDYLDALRAQTRVKVFEYVLQIIDAYKNIKEYQSKGNPDCYEDRQSVKEKE